MSDLIADRVRLFLAQEDMEREDVRVYMANLRGMAEGLNSKINRGSASIALAFTIFLILSHGNLTEAEIFNVKVQDFSIFRLLIPVFVSFVIARMISIVSAMIHLEDPYEELLRQHMPKWQEAKIGTIPMSTGGIFFIFVPELLDEKAAKRRTKSFRIEFAILISSPIVFGAYAYASIFADDKIGVGWALLSLLAMLGGVAMGLHQIATYKH